MELNGIFTAFEKMYSQTLATLKSNGFSFFRILLMGSAISSSSSSCTFLIISPTLKFYQPSHGGDAVERAGKVFGYWR